MSRDRFIEIIAELRQVDEQLRPLLERKVTLEAERDALWPASLPAPSQLAQQRRKEKEQPAEPVEEPSVAEQLIETGSIPAPPARGRLVLPLTRQQLEKARATIANYPRARGAIRFDGPTAGPRVVAYLEQRPGEWLKARQICEGMGLDPEMFLQAIRSSLDRLVAAKAVLKNEQSEFRFHLKPAEIGEESPA